MVLAPEIHVSCYKSNVITIKALDEILLLCEPWPLLSIASQNLRKTISNLALCLAALLDDRAIPVK